jgi:SAM-dependent methyltransferase
VRPAGAVRQRPGRWLRWPAREVRDLLLRVGCWRGLKDPDRRVLEGTLFPFLLSRPDVRRVLFVGCHWYTWHYKRIFAGREFITIDCDPERARYGGHRHVVDSAANVADHFAAGSLDIVLFLGVIGWGLDDLPTAEVAVAGMHRCLRPGGLLVVSVDEVPEHLPFEVSAIAALRGFEPVALPAFGTTWHRCDDAMRHTFYFFRKPGSDAG